MKRSIIAAVATVAVFATAAFAEVVFDSLEGTGFVGKGDVQLALGLNNKQLQEQADGLIFTASSVQPITWECLNPAGKEIQFAQRIATTAVANSVARERNQITGFYLKGYEGNPTEEISGGFEPGECPTPMVFVKGSVVWGEYSDTKLYVNGVALN
jgi:opacity protein-like surface antigen